MKRLIERGLMFGNLVHVTSPVLVERYNRALMHLTGKSTALGDFHVDISGFSPEIGAELDDELYLNHNGVNRQFILLTTEQKRAPLLNAKFSTSRTILRSFIETNEAQLFALTAKDAVAGELVNSVFRVESPARLFDIRRIKVEADTTAGTVATAGRLGRLIDRFKQEDDAWFDDVLIAQMIELARQTGDVVRNPVALAHTEFEQDNFWTAHFGGLYIFRDVAEPAAIAAGDKAALGALPIESVYDLRDRTKIAIFLEVNGLAEPIVRARGIDAAAILYQKMDFVVAELAARLGEDLRGATRRDLRALGRRHAERLPEEYHGLAALARWAEDGGPWPRITSEHPAYFYTLRAAAVPDADLVNRLLAQLSPLDIRQLFICHKEAFYDAYARWPEEKRAYVADFLAREYQVDKAGTRDALFGHEASMDEPQNIAPPAPRPDDLIARVGPWGAVRRS
ncbi:hypothetical protein OG2516_07912 [Oceanicola granulosus HTCC2516]|uniref:Uncharacterized protein n=1 Tax=Oceanicola granulosus (strain ATCC BAA-861 / DSM 15982 / KCTC 12143 / HTCC2516) TaxID=314256 RepID=Q2CI72_OCEGH|nr:DUF6638 family protein [Oceanicola granulosus]EAR52386.1 hypothetical protein OG2516_07912 [Oceanicola granulosus HTCC2516]